MDAGLLKTIVDRLVIDELDHKDLNRDVPWLEGRMTTSENTAQAIFDRIAPEIIHRAPGVELDSVRLHETRRISVAVTRKDL